MTQKLLSTKRNTDPTTVIKRGTLSTNVTKIRKAVKTVEIETEIRNLNSRIVLVMEAIIITIIIIIIEIQINSLIRKKSKIRTLRSLLTLCQASMEKVNQIIYTINCSLTHVQASICVIIKIISLTLILFISRTQHLLAMEKRLPSSANGLV